MSKQKMLQARELLQTKRYDEARAILETIDHPTAHKWLAKLDQIAPPKKSARFLEPPYIYYGIALSTIVLLLIIVLFAINLFSRPSNILLSQAKTRFEQACMGFSNILIASNPDLDVTIYCRQMAESLANQYPDALISCHQKVEDIENNILKFSMCLELEGVENLNTSDLDANNLVGQEKLATEATLLTNTPAATNTPIATHTPELGSRSNPYPYSEDTVYNVGNGWLIVAGYYRDMTSKVLEMNMFNDEPANDEEWILMLVVYECGLSPDEVCDASLFDFEVVGRMGTIYERPFAAVIIEEFGGNVLGGEQIGGIIGFIVKKADSDFQLIVKPSMFSDKRWFFETIELEQS